MYIQQQQQQQQQQHPSRMLIQSKERIVIASGITKVGRVLAG